MQPAQATLLGAVDSASRRTGSLLCMMKVLYFLNGFSGASFGRFATLFYLSSPRNFNAGQIGIIESVGPPVAFVGNTLFGWLSDELQRKKAVSLSTQVITTATITSFLVPQLGCCFEPILLLMATTAFFSVGGGVLDSYTLDLLGQRRRDEYGKYRLWLAVSWGVGNAAMGAVAELNFDYNLVGFCALNVLTIGLVATLLPARTSGEVERMNERRERAAVAAAAATASPGASPDGGGGKQSLRACVCTLCSARFVAFLLEAAFVGLAFTFTDKFLFVYLINELDGSPTLCGLSVACTVIFELPIFQCGAALLKHVGHELMVLGALAAYAVRVYGYTRLEAHTVWWVLALEPLHGITFALAWTAFVDKVKAEVPEAWHTSGQLALNTAMNCVGRVAGSLIGGFFILHGELFGLRGCKALYALGALATACVLTAHVATSGLLKACGRRALMTPPPAALPLSVQGEAPLGTQEQVGGSPRPRARSAGAGAGAAD